MSIQDPIGIGIIGGGLMGREAFAAFGRWAALTDHPVRPRLVAVADPSPDARRWFADQGVDTLADHGELLARDDVDVVYAAVPHDLHERIYLDVLDAGKDLFAEKPFGIDHAAAERIVAAVERTGLFVRCSSEFPFFPGAQLAIDHVLSGAIGPIIEVRSSFLHSSDLSRSKPINWKRQRSRCGEIGVLADLGMHAAHVPLRLGWKPRSVRAILQDLVPERPDGAGGMAACDTPENATLSCRVAGPDGDFPLTMETKRIAPGEMDTWTLEVVGMDGGVAFSTRYPATTRRFRVSDRGEQVWEEVQAGHNSVFATITGGIFEFGFTDALLQMWAAYLAERAGVLDDRFGCATPAEALTSHELFAAALASDRSDTVIAL
ncbi:MAG: Gfo/Idh/MocA family oxidoreductase [Planctomycetota bacterium]